MDLQLLFYKNILSTDPAPFHFQAISVRSLGINSDNGNVRGSIAAIQDGMTVVTDNGDVDIGIHISPNATNPQFDLNTDNGDVKLKFVSMVKHSIALSRL